MSGNLYFRNCLREIRQTVFGRDMRKPIADACEIVHANVSAEDIARNHAMMEELTQRIEAVPKEVITNVNMSLILSDEYCVVISRHQ